MDLSSSGTKLILFLTFCVISSGQILTEANIDSPYRYEHNDELREDTQVSGDVYIIDKLSSENVLAVEELLQNVVNTNSKVFVKIAGHGISIIRDLREMSDVFKYTDDQRKHNIVDDILDVLQMAEKRIHIYIITEKGSNVAEGTEAQMLLLKERDLRIDILHLHDRNYDTRQRRQINFYQLLANVSGGSVIQTNKQNIGSALNLLKQSIKTSLVHVMRFSDTSPPGKQFRIPVDETMTQLIFRAQVERSNPIIIAMTPSGIPSPNRPQLLGKASAGTVVGLLETNLSKPTDYGTWKISKLDANLWDIKVDGQSSVDFTHEFLEPGPGGFGEFPINGRPIVGKTYKLSITVPEYAKVKTVAMGMLFNIGQNTPIDMKPLTNVGGRRGKSMFHAQFAIPTKNFMVGIEGRDKSGHMFRRIDTILITPISLKLIMPSLTGLKFFQNETLTIPFTVVNEGSKEQDVDVKIEDDKKFAQAPHILSATIKPGQNFTAKFVIKAGLTVGETTTVTVTAKPYLGPRQFSQGQFEIRRFTVLDKNLTTTTLTTPTTTTTSTTSASTTSTQTTLTTSASMSTTVATTSARTTKSVVSTTQPLTSVNTKPTPGSSSQSPAKSTTATTAKSVSTTTSATSLSSLKYSVSAAFTGPTVKQTGSVSTVSSTTLSTKPTKTVAKMASSVTPSAISKSSSSASTLKSRVTTKTTVLPPAATITTTTTKSNNDKKSDNTDLPTTSIVVGISTGALVGVAAIGTMALLFRRAMKKSGKSVEPSKETLYDRRRQSSLAWT
ncbi:uncharacterized protein LOC123560447 [Mercenaria mercenaria]|uniref:uncharacterized protein LOC123560447 n=1 Tax=Mercenaria mercenaria TaxID=6596 RepID=UPI00234F1C96|nr:uncharacterized protein LOC123560447 [Mercenaria mercenaria]